MASATSPGERGVDASATRDDALVSCPHPAYREVIFSACRARALVPRAAAHARARRRALFPARAQATFDDLDSLESGHARSTCPRSCSTRRCRRGRRPGRRHGTGALPCHTPRQDALRDADRGRRRFMLSAALDRKAASPYRRTSSFPSGARAARAARPFVAVLSRETADGAGGAASGVPPAPVRCAAVGARATRRRKGARARARLASRRRRSRTAAREHVDSVTHLRRAPTCGRSRLDARDPLGNAHYLYGQPALGGAPAPPPPPASAASSLRNRLPVERAVELPVPQVQPRPREGVVVSFLVYDAAVLDGAPHIDGRAAGTDDAVLQFGKSRQARARLPRARLGAGGDRALRCPRSRSWQIGPLLCSV